MRSSCESTTRLKTKTTRLKSPNHFPSIIVRSPTKQGRLRLCIRPPEQRSPPASMVIDHSMMAASYIFIPEFCLWRILCEGARPRVHAVAAAETGARRFQPPRGGSSSARPLCWVVCVYPEPGSPPISAAPSEASHVHQGVAAVGLSDCKRMRWRTGARGGGRSVDGHGVRAVVAESIDVRGLLVRGQGLRRARPPREPSRGGRAAYTSVMGIERRLQPLSGQRLRWVRILFRRSRTRQSAPQRRGFRRGGCGREDI
jgi:hypothetical protein